MTYEKRWDEKRWAGIRWEEFRWDEVWSVKSAVWSVGREECSVKCEVWSVKKAMRSEKCEVWTVKCEVWSVKCGLGRVQCEVRSVKCWLRRVQCESVKTVKCEVWRGASSVTCATRHQFRRVHARTGLAGARRMQVSIDEKGLIYIFKATSAPPRGGYYWYVISDCCHTNRSAKHRHCKVGKLKMN